MTELRYPVRYCVFCGHELATRSVYCEQCGKAVSRPLIERKEPPYPWSPRAAFGVALLAYFVFMLCTIGIMFYYVIFLGIPPTFAALTRALTDPGFLMLAMTAELVFLLIPLAYIRGLSVPLARLGLTSGGVTRGLKDLVLGLAVGIAMVPLMLGFTFYDLVSSGFGPPPTPLGPLDIFWLGMTCLGIILFVAPAEEILFRGFVQNSLDAHYGNVAGILAASIVFGLAHLDPLVGVAHMIGGVVLGLLFRRLGRRLTGPIVAHATYDCLIFILDAFLI
jgi:membrane protease YdiL (CAAX protease family)